MPREIDYPQFQHPVLTDFAELARQYCHLIEARGTMSSVDFLHRLHLLLPQLYATGLRLPWTTVLWDPALDDEDEDYDPGYVESPADPDRASLDERGSLCRDLEQKVGELNFYREVLDPFQPREEHEEVLGSLSDDLTDTFGELNCGLRKWDRGESGQALFEWRFGLEVHWGEHVTGAIRALHVRASSWDTWFPPS